MSACEGQPRHVIVNPQTTQQRRQKQRVYRHESRCRHVQRATFHESARATRARVSTYVRYNTKFVAASAQNGRKILRFARAAPRSAAGMVVQQAKRARGEVCRMKSSVERATRR